MLAGIYLGWFLKLWLMVTDCCSKATWLLFPISRLFGFKKLDYMSSWEAAMKLVPKMQNHHALQKVSEDVNVGWWTKDLSTTGRVSSLAILSQCFTFLRTSKTGWMTLSNIFFGSRKRIFHVILWCSAITGFSHHESLDPDPCKVSTTPRKSRSKLLQKVLSSTDMNILTNLVLPRASYWRFQEMKWHLMIMKYMKMIRDGEIKIKTKSNQILILRRIALLMGVGGLTGFDGESSVPRPDSRQNNAARAACHAKCENISGSLWNMVQRVQHHDATCCQLGAFDRVWSSSLRINGKQMEKVLAFSKSFLLRKKQTWLLM